MKLIGEVREDSERFKYFLMNFGIIYHYYQGISSAILETLNDFDS